MNWYIKVLKNYAVFNGRAGRPEFWYSLLIHALVVFVLSLVESFGGFQERSLTGIYLLAVFLPMLAVSVRRLHDTDRSGWWILLGAIPLIGAIVLLVWYAQAGTGGENRFGSAPPAEQ